MSTPMDRPVIPTGQILQELLRRTDVSREARALLDFVSLPLSWPLLLKVKPGDGHRVLIIPGYGGDDATYLPLRFYLNLLGYRTYGWIQGQNRGPTPHTGRRLIERLDEIFERSGGDKVSLVGQSMGGIYARELARRFPDKVRQVVCLATPVNQPMASRILDERLSPEMFEEFRRSGFRVSRPTHINVPCTQIYSRGDGLVTEEQARLEETRLAQNVHIDSTHSGMGFNSLAYYVIADRLATSLENWTPFEWPPFLQGLVLATGAFTQVLEAFRVPFSMTGGPVEAEAPLPPLPPIPEARRTRSRRRPPEG